MADRLLLESSSARDTFERTVVDGWGTADTGGAWSGTAANFDVTAGVGTIDFSAVQFYHPYLTVTQTDFDAVCQFSISALPPSGNTVLVGITVRRNAALTNGYEGLVYLKDNSTLIAGIFKRVAGSETGIGSNVAAGTYAVDHVIKVRFQVIGTSLKLRVWNATTGPEPTTWQREASDSSLTAEGYVGLYAYNSSVTARTLSVDDIALGSATTDGYLLEDSSGVLLNEVDLSGGGEAVEFPYVGAGYYS